MYTALALLILLLSAGTTGVGAVRPSHRRVFYGDCAYRTGPTCAHSREVTILFREKSAIHPAGYTSSTQCAMKNAGNNCSDFEKTSYYA